MEYREGEGLYIDFFGYKFNANGMADSRNDYVFGEEPINVDEPPRTPGRGMDSESDEESSGEESSGEEGSGEEGSGEEGNSGEDSSGESNSGEGSSTSGSSGTNTGRSSRGSEENPVTNRSEYGNNVEDPRNGNNKENTGRRIPKQKSRPKPYSRPGNPNQRIEIAVQGNFHADIHNKRIMMQAVKQEEIDLVGVEFLEQDIDKIRQDIDAMCHAKRFWLAYKFHNISLKGIKYTKTEISRLLGLEPKTIFNFVKRNRLRNKTCVDYSGYSPLEDGKVLKLKYDYYRNHATNFRELEERGIFGNRQGPIKSVRR